MSRAHTRLLMAASALFLFCLGAVLTFAPSETVAKAGGPHVPLLVALAQACGALYLGFAILNWMAKENLIGGIYSRPVAMGNFLHFFAVAMALLKSFPVLPHAPGIIALVVLYVCFAISFGSSSSGTLKRTNLQGVPCSQGSEGLVYKSAAKLGLRGCAPSVGSLMGAV